uniref:Tyrosine-protein phosphatase domain-containing protein n=1 Tax=Panagrellus redivivus TaxID=6233 RepID=A0A7E4W6U7_PANRE
MKPTSTIIPISLDSPVNIYKLFLARCQSMFTHHIRMWWPKDSSPIHGEGYIVKVAFMLHVVDGFEAQKAAGEEEHADRRE